MAGQGYAIFAGNYRVFRTATEQTPAGLCVDVDQQSFIENPPVFLGFLQNMRAL
jgi:hypothetical protein